MSMLPQILFTSSNCHNLKTIKKNHLFLQKLYQNFVIQTIQFYQVKQKYFSQQMNEDKASDMMRSLLKMQSSTFQHEFSEIKKTKKRHKRGSSMLFKQLKRINNQGVQKKRQLIVKYLKNLDQMKSSDQTILQIQKQGNAIPVLQVAISLSKYDKRLLSQLLDTQTIQQKQINESKQFQLSQQIQNDPILQLLSDSQIMKKICPQKKQLSYVDYKIVSPQKKSQVIDQQKGKFKKLKLKNYNKVQFPKQLTQLKKQLFSLPYINRYKDILLFKSQLKAKHLDTQLKHKSQILNIQHINQLNNKSLKSNKSSIIHSNRKQPYDQEKQLEMNLQKALLKRGKNYQKDTSDKYLSNLSVSKTKNLFPNINSKEFSKTNFKTQQTGFNNNGNTIQSFIKSQDISIVTKNGLSSTKKYLSPPPQLNKSHSTIRDTQNQSDLNPEDDTINSTITKHNKNKYINKDNYWPSYQRYNIQNSSKFIDQVQKIRSQVKLFTQMNEVPSQSTLKMYYSLKKVQQNDLDKLKNQSLKQQKQFSNTKFKIKYKNLKQNYSKRVKDFIKDKKKRQFELQQCSALQSTNLAFKQVKLNQKMLAKLVNTQNC